MNASFITGQRLSIFAGLAIAATVAAAVWFEPPWEYRDRAFDRQRASDLTQIGGRLNGYGGEKGALPEDLQTLAGTRYDGWFGAEYTLDWHDPETGAPYAYTRTGKNTYKICAAFARASDGGYTIYGQERRHTAGLNCYDESVPLRHK
jgi:hypothetical protein